MESCDTMLVCFVIFASLITTGLGGRHCYECNNVPDPRDCGDVTECSGNYECFLTSKISSNGILLYDMGCRQPRLCKNSRRDLYSTMLISRQTSQLNMAPPADLDLEPPVGRSKRRDGDTVFCESCCDSDFCNHAGCGISATPRDQRGPYCFTCPVQDREDNCIHVSVCEKGAVCAISNKTLQDSLLLQYQTECIPMMQCKAVLHVHHPHIPGVHATSGTITKCPMCCQDDYCNNDCLHSFNTKTTIGANMPRVISSTTTTKSTTATTKPPPTTTKPPPTTTKPPPTTTKSTTATIKPTTTITESKTTTVKLTTATKSTTMTTNLKLTKPPPPTTTTTTTTKPIRLTTMPTMPVTTPPLDTTTTITTTSQIPTTNPLTTTTTTKSPITTTNSSTTTTSSPTPTPNQPTTTSSPTPTTNQPTTTSSPTTTMNQPTTTTNSTTTSTLTTQLSPVPTTTSNVTNREYLCQQHGYTYHHSIHFCYRLYFAKKSWNDANAVCMQEGGTLAVVNTGAKWRHLRTIIEHAHRFTGRIWLGLSDVHNTDTLVWADGHPLDYADFDHVHGEPSGGDQNCVYAMEERDRQWHDTTCSSQNQFVCTIKSSKLH